MVFHIAIDGITGVGKTMQIQSLINYFEEDYKVCKRTIPANIEIQQILKNYRLKKHEVALLLAFDRSLSFYGEDWSQYDLVFWDTSIIQDYVYYADDETPEFFIKQINRFFPPMDLIIIILNEELIKNKGKSHHLVKLNNKYNKISESQNNTKTIQYIYNKPTTMTKNIIKTITENLPRCEWCGKIFTPTQKHKKYCKKKCSEEANREQCRENNRTYYHKYKDVMSERQKGGLGSKGANLHGTADPNPIRELEKVRNAKRALGLKPIK